MTPTIIVGSDGLIRCLPEGSVPSEEMLRQIIATVRGQLSTRNLYVHIRPVDRYEFDMTGWVVAGIVSNYFGLGEHALRMRLPV
jgi:hypothetical protein